MTIMEKKGGGRLKKVNAKFSKGVDFWKFGVLTEEQVEAKKWQKNAKNLHRTGRDVQELTFFNSRRSVEFASEGQKTVDFWSRIALQDELFFMVILNTDFVDSASSPRLAEAVGGYDCGSSFCQFIVLK